MILIGVIGRANQGKSTAANVIARHATDRGYFARIYEVSHLILKYCQKAGLIAPGKTRADCSPVDVQTLITVGHEKRIEDQNYWLDSISDMIQTDGADVAIIPNVRADNEAAYVRSNGGVILRVVSTNSDGTPYIAMDRDPNNRFETISQTLQADFEIKTPRGAEDLAKSYARALFDHLAHKEIE